MLVKSDLRWGSVALISMNEKNNTFINIFYLYKYIYSKATATMLWHHIMKVAPPPTPTPLPPDPRDLWNVSFPGHLPM